MRNEDDRMKAADLYDCDFAEWTARNATLLRQRRFDEADVEHVAEEIEDMGKRDRREVSNRLKVLIAHLLKWAAQPDRRDGSTWSATIGEQRSELDEIFEQSPSLRRYADQDMARIYGRAVTLAARETGLERSVFPQESAYTLDQLLDIDYLP
jgi:Domain of unknown function DUF29